MFYLFFYELWKGNIGRNRPEEHSALFITPWRNEIPYVIIDAAGPNGLNTATATIDDIKTAARKVYKDYPEILEALGL